MTISDNLYNKYINKQKECHNLLLELENKYNVELDLMRKYQSARLSHDQAVANNELIRIKVEIAISAAVSDSLREFLLEIAMENGGIS